MKKNLKILSKRKIFFLFSIMFFGALTASIDFVGRSSCIVLQNENSKIAYGSEPILGWLNDSILKPSGNEDLRRLDINLDGAISYNEIPATGESLLLLDGIFGSQTIFGRSILASPINLNGGTLTTNGDMIFSSKTTIDSSGVLSPIGNAFILGGDLVIPDGVELKLTTSGIFDGQGHSLTFGSNSKIKLDSYITVTFKNIKLLNVKNYSDGNSSISILNPWRSRLAFENSQICLASDFSFTQGQLYFHRDVTISGTNQFNYTSTNFAFISKASSLTLDTGLSFSYGPAGSDNRNLIMMEDQTSKLCLNGVTLKSTNTGMRLSKGTLIVDHKNYIYNENDSTTPARSLSEAVEFGDLVDGLYIEIMPSANIEVMSGILTYRESAMIG